MAAYLAADQRLVDLYADADGWARMAILNVVNAGKFSSDRTIGEYAADIWQVQPTMSRSIAAHVIVCLALSRCQGVFDVPARV